MGAITLKNVYFRYDESSSTILNGVNYDFEYGKFYLLFGDSGGGKSTILSILNGYIPHYKEGQFRGEILHDGMDIFERDIGERSSFISSLFQNPDEQILFDKVEDELAFPLENIGVPQEAMIAKIEDSCHLLALDKRAKTSTLSGGEKQRLEACSALSLPNKIILLDEPLANLDKVSSELLLGELRRRVKEEGSCVILVEHRLDRLKPYIDVAAKVEDGKLVEVQDPFTEKVISKYPSKISEEVVLSAKNLGVNIKKKALLKGISFDLHKGEKLLVLGDNGAGKTTLLRALSLLIKHQEGEVSSPYLRKKNWFKEVGYLFQNPDYQLFLKTVEEEIYLSEVDDEYTKHLIEVFGLQDKLEKHPLSLSEGQKRKLTFVTTLAKKPKILFLDEPTVGQDYESLTKFVDEVNNLVNENGTSVITVTHDRRCMEALMDDCLIIEKGKPPRYGGEALMKEYISSLYED